MKKTIQPGNVPESWSAESLYLKALRYAERVHRPDTDDSEKALWSGLSLELLARAALANVDPVLLAESGESWQNIFSALGFPPTESKFSPKSVTMSEVFRRLKAIFPLFTKEIESSCLILIGKRNAELHSGEAVFEGVVSSTWQPSFYLACSVLLGTMKVELTEFLGADQAVKALKMIKAAEDGSAKAVKSDVDAHAKVWQSKDENDKKALTGSAKSWAIRQDGHRVNCPACESKALVIGEPIGVPHQKLSDGKITETQEHLPYRFECVACGLKIIGLSRLVVLGLGDPYKKTMTFDAADYYAPEDMLPDFDDDNNESF